MLLLLSDDFTRVEQNRESRLGCRFGRFLTLINSRPAERADRRKVEIKEGMEVEGAILVLLPPTLCSLTQVTALAVS